MSMSEQIDLAARSAKIKQSIINKVTMLIEKARIPNVPIDQQLSFDDIDRFYTLRNRFAFIVTDDYIESERARDVSAIARMWQLSESEYQSGLSPYESSPDYPFYVFLQAIRLSVGDKLSIAGSPPERECDIQTAISASENDAEQSLNAMSSEIDRGNQQLQLLVARYQKSGEKIDPAVMNPEDRAAYETILNDVFRPATRIRIFLEDMEALKKLDQLSALRAKFNRDDFISTGGDASVLDKRYLAAVSKDETREVLAGLLAKIAKRFPSEAANQLQGQTSMLSAIGKTPDKVHRH
jgi:hypothetical protein